MSTRVGTVFGLATVIASVAVIRHNYLPLADAERRRVRWVAYGSVVGLAPTILWSLFALFDLAGESRALRVPAVLWAIADLSAVGGSVA